MEAERGRGRPTIYELPEILQIDQDDVDLDLVTQSTQWSKSKRDLALNVNFDSLGDAPLHEIFFCVNFDIMAELACGSDPVKCSMKLRQLLREKIPSSPFLASMVCQPPRLL